MVFKSLATPRSTGLCVTVGVQTGENKVTFILDAVQIRRLSSMVRLEMEVLANRIQGRRRLVGSVGSSSTRPILRV